MAIPIIRRSLVRFMKLDFQRLAIPAAVLTAPPVLADDASPAGLWKNVDDGSKKLSVRGYIGVPMLGRSQTWLRQE